MVVRGAAGRKIPHSRVFHGETLYFMEKGSALISATAYGNYLLRLICNIYKTDTINYENRISEIKVML